MCLIRAKKSVNNAVVLPTLDPTANCRQPVSVMTMVVEPAKIAIERHRLEALSMQTICVRSNVIMNIDWQQRGQGSENTYRIPRQFRICRRGKTSKKISRESKYELFTKRSNRENGTRRRGFSLISRLMLHTPLDE